MADTGNDTIRQILLNGGLVSTLAGKAGVSGELNGDAGVATFASPRGLAVDGFGNLFIADANDGGIRMLAFDGGLVTTFLSSQTALGGGLKGPTALAYDEATPGALYVAGSDAVWFTDGGMVSVVVGAPGDAGNTDSPPRFASPGGLINIVNQSKLLVADTGNDVIRVVSLDAGTVLTVAGTAPNPGPAEGIGTSAMFDSPGGIATDEVNLYVTDTGANTIREIGLVSGLVTTLAGIAFLPGSTNGIGPAALFRSPSGLVYDGAGNLFVSDTGNDTIREIALDGGNVTTVAGMIGVAGEVNGASPLTSSFNAPTGLAISSNPPLLYVADSKNSSIRQITISGGSLGTVSTAASHSPGDALNIPTGLVMAEGYLLFADQGSNTVCAVFNGGVNPIVGTPYQAGWLDGSVTVGGAFTTLMSRPRSLTFVAPSSFYIADEGNSAVRLMTFDPANPLGGAVLSTLIGTPGQSGVLVGPLPAGLNGPTGIAYVPAFPALFITDSVENVILQAR